MDSGTLTGGAILDGIGAVARSGRTDVQPTHSRNKNVFGMEDSIPFPMAAVRKVRIHKYQAMRLPVSHSSLTKVTRLVTNHARKPTHNISPTTPCSSRMRPYSFSTSTGRFT